MNGMFLSYVVIAKIVRRIDEKLSNCTNTNANYLERCVQKYHGLLLHTKLINDCFQNMIALPFKFVMILMELCWVLRYWTMDFVNLRVWLQYTYAFTLWWAPTFVLELHSRLRALQTRSAKMFWKMSNANW